MSNAVDELQQWYKDLDNSENLSINEVEEIMWNIYRLEEFLELDSQEH